VLPDDDSQARYFGLCIAALQETALLQGMGLVPLFGGQSAIDREAAEVIMAECGRRGFVFGDLEVSEKSAEFIELWMRGVDGGQDGNRVV